MTRNNVYAGPAGFWLIRDPTAPGGENGLAATDAQGNPSAARPSAEGWPGGTGPQRAGRRARRIREIPIVIQDRSFNADGSLFYPSTRAFFQEVKPNKINIPFIGDPKATSDIAAIWNPEAFFQVMVVNGVSWPVLEVEPDLYRFRLLNGCNSRFLNLACRPWTRRRLCWARCPSTRSAPSRACCPKVVKVETGFRRPPSAGNGHIAVSAPERPWSAADPQAALLMGLAERADIIVDFSNLPAGTTRVRMINTAPDAPFGGFPDIPADPGHHRPGDGVSSGRGHAGRRGLHAHRRTWC